MGDVDYKVAMFHFTISGVGYKLLVQGVKQALHGLDGEIGQQVDVVSEKKSPVK